jgi:hypothetical protein
VAPDLRSLGTQVNGVAPGTSLGDKVKQVQADLAVSDTTDACSGLANFIGLVKAQNGKKLTMPQSASYVQQAQNIEAEIGC